MYLGVCLMWLYCRGCALCVVVVCSCCVIRSFVVVVWLVCVLLFVVNMVVPLCC